MILSLTRAMISSTVVPPYGLSGPAGRACDHAKPANRIAAMERAAGVRKNLKVIVWTQRVGTPHLRHRRHCKCMGSRKETGTATWWQFGLEGGQIGGYDTSPASNRRHKLPERWTPASNNAVLYFCLGLACEVPRRHLLHAL